jgi:NDP-sugar pyrophosphorylase family protein
MRIEVSREEELLDTGGGLKKAAHFFSGSQEPFIVHNVDVISTIDLGRMLRFHEEENALATLAVQERESARQLLFDEQGRLCGRLTGNNDAEAEMAKPAARAQALAFCGIHVLSPQIFVKLNEEGAFSIIDAYMRLAAQGEKIIAYRADECYWRDLGRPESVLQAEQDLGSGKYSIA